MSSRKVSIPPHLKTRLAHIHVLSYAEMKRLLAVISDLRDRALFLLAYRHGLRASEVSKMEQADVDFPRTRLSIRRVARGVHHYHPLQKDELHSLTTYLQSRTDQSVALFTGLHDKPITRRGLDWLMKLYGKMARLPAIKQHFHVLKHSISVHLLGAGVALQLVHSWLGHSALKNTSHYIYLASPPKDASILLHLLGTLPTATVT